MSHCCGLRRSIVATCSKTDGEQQKEEIAELAHVSDKREKSGEEVGVVRRNERNRRWATS